MHDCKAINDWPVLFERTVLEFDPSRPASRRLRGSIYSSNTYSCHETGQALTINDFLGLGHDVNSKQKHLDFYVTTGISTSYMNFSCSFKSFAHDVMACFMWHGTLGYKVQTVFGADTFCITTLDSSSTHPNSRSLMPFLQQLLNHKMRCP